MNNPEQTPSPAQGTQAVDRAARVLAAVVDAETPMAFTELADQCGLPKSTTSRLLTALERTDLVERTEAGYVPGPVLWRYAARHDPWAEVSRLARPAMTVVGEATGETVHLGVPRAGRVAHVAQHDSSFLLGLRDWTDVDVPAHLSALGKVLLAWDALSPDPKLEPLTERSITRQSTLRRALTEVRDQGWASTVDELEVGLTAIAAPVFLGDEIFGALGVSGPTIRLESRIPEIADLLNAQSTGLSAALTHRSHRKGVA